jgi:hypothetical protein
MAAGDEELRRARQADDLLVTRLVVESGSGQGKRAPVDCPVPSRDIWSRALRLRLQGSAGGEALRALTNATTLAGGIGLIGALFLPGLAIAPRSGRARLCRRCGRPFCRRCQVVTRFPDNCAPCVHLFILKDGLAPAVRDRKKREVARHQQQIFLRTRIASFLLPGSGHALSGRPFLGALLLCLWATAWIGVAMHGRLLVAAAGIQAPRVSAGLTALLTLALGVWLVANLTRQEGLAE